MTKRKKIILIITVLIIGYFVLGKYRERDFLNRLIKQNPNPEICIQVITLARNPKTGEVRDFPTPCDVPQGWEKLGVKTIQ